jgi:tetratricopeptide (TPR) repeat protein
MGRSGQSAQSAWARRILAQVYIARASLPKRREALALFEPAGPAGSAIVDPEDLRVLARVHEAQQTPDHQRRAIAILESLVGRNIANPGDRLLLARLQEAAGDWPKAREQFRELILRTENPRDGETLNRRPFYLTVFAEALIKHRRPGEDQDLDEAQGLLEKLKRLQPDRLGTVMLEVELDQARNRPDEAAALIRSYANRPKVPPVVQETLAKLAEQIGQLELAEQIYQRIATEAGDGPNQVVLATFLGRHARIQDALDICERLRANPRNRNAVDLLAMGLLYPPGIRDPKPDPVQVKRVMGWLEQGVAQDPQATRLVVALGNLYERLKGYGKAAELYRRAIQIGDRDGVASNNLAWLIALTGDSGGEALELINHAIKLKGPLPDFLDTRGVVYLKASEGQRAIADLKTAVAADASASKHFHLAQAYLKANEKENAKKSLEAAKAQGLPEGLHPLELPAYHQVVIELERP